MSKIKMRCTTCGKWFQSANAKEVTCPDCVQKARKEKLAAKTGSPSSIKTTGQVAQGTVSPSRPSPPPPPKSKPVSSGTSHWIDSVNDIKVSEPEQPQRSKLPSSPTPRDTRSGSGPDQFGSRGPGAYREGGSRGPGTYRESGTSGYRDDHGSGGYRQGGPAVSGSIGQRPRQPMEGGFGRGPRPGVGGEPRPDRFHPDGKKGGKPTKAKVPKPPTPSKPKREKIPPPTPFTPTAEQIAQVEARYMELAVPTEFDGIRTQIAKEIAIPKKAVKKIIKDLRDRQGIPSWWEVQTYKGDSEELAKIKAAYEPYLPLPPVGVHKTIAEELSLKPGEVYQAIKAIRLEMDLPQYNDPALHGLEKTSREKKQLTTSEEEVKESREEKAETSALEPETPGETTEVKEPAAETPADPTEVVATTSVDSATTQEK